MHVLRPDGGPFFNQNGILFLPLPEVKDTTQQLIKAQPFLGGLAADPSLRGIMANLSTYLLGVQAGQAKLADFDIAMARFADVLTAAARGRVDYLSWRSLITGSPAKPEELRRFIEVKPRLDFNALEPGKEANDTIRADARALGLIPANGVSVRLTGPVPLSDEEFATLTDRVGLMVGAMMGGVLLTLWLALRSFRIIFAILVTLFVGLAITMGVGLKAVGVFNIISIAFIALFVGLGVDFGIQFSVRYRSERHRDDDLMQALASTGRGVGIPLALAAAATAAGFFSFLPTTYTGVAELGLVAGIGMIVAFLLSITMLPAMIMLLNPPGETEDVGFTSAGTAGRFHDQTPPQCGAHRGYRRRAVARADGLRAVRLQSAGPAQPQGGIGGDPVRPDEESADLAQHDRRAGTVADRRGLCRSPYRPGAAGGRGAHLVQLRARPAEGKAGAYPGRGQSAGPNARSAGCGAAPRRRSRGAELPGYRRQAARRCGNAQDKPARDARRLADALDAVVKAGPPARARAAEALVPGLKTMLGQVADSLKAAPVTVDNMPADLRSDWVASDGTARIQVFPKDNSNDPAALSAFSDQVLSVAPQATGAPISIRESGKTIVGAFAEAGFLSFVVIIILLAAVLEACMTC